MQPLGLAQNGACVLEEGAASLGGSHALPAPCQQSDTERIFHVADAGRGGGKRKMRAFGAVGDAARLDDMAKQAEIGEIKSHEMTLPSHNTKLDFAKCPLHISVSRICFRLIRNEAANSNDDLCV